jgi:aspartyl-tRNA(Asn)/glutamyl-tRNA(Gln) amidotransferase subunit C
MKISGTDVEHVAKLANLDVADDEKQGLAEQLSRIVEYVEQLESVDTDDVEPTAEVTPYGVVERPDAVAPREGSGEAAEKIGLFRVPKVIRPPKSGRRP